MFNTMSVKKYIAGVSLAFIFSILVGSLPIFTAPVQAADPCTIIPFWKDPQGKDYGRLPSNPQVGWKYTMVGQFKECPGKGYAQLVLTRPNGTTETSARKALSGSFVDILMPITFTTTGEYRFLAQIVDSNGVVVKIPSAQGGGPVSLSDPSSPAQVVPATAAPPPSDGNPDPTTTPPPAPPGPPDSNDDSLGSAEVLESPIDITSLGELVVRLIRYLLIFVGSLSVLFIIIGGLKMVSSAGNEKAITSGKQTVQWAIIGLVVSLMAFTVVSIVQGFLGR